MRDLTNCAPRLLAAFSNTVTLSSAMTEWSQADSWVDQLTLRTSCIRQVILLALDPVLEAFGFSSGGRYLALHLFTTDIVRHGGRHTRERQQCPS